MAIVDQPPFAGTAVGGCVAGRFRGARIPAFDGVNLTIGKRFTVAAGAPVAPDPPRR